jgi:hypothetical protein
MIGLAARLAFNPLKAKQLAAKYYIRLELPLNAKATRGSCRCGLEFFWCLNPFAGVLVEHGPRPESSGAPARKKDGSLSVSSVELPVSSFAENQPRSR